MQSTANANGSPTPDLPARVPPGPRGLAWLGVVRDIARADVPGMLLRGARTYGDVVRYRFGGTTCFFVTAPDDVRRVLVENARNYARSPTYAELSFIMGQGLVVADGPLWRRHRRIVQPVFSRQRIDALLPRIAASIESELERWRSLAEGPPVDLVGEMNRLTLSVAGRVILDIDLGEAAGTIGASLLTAFTYVSRRQRSLLKPPAALPTPARRRARRAVAALDEAVFRLIRERRAASGADPTDLLSVLAKARDDETGEGLTDRELRDELITMVIGGFETTSMGLTWASYLLSRHPDAARRLRDEAAGVLGDRTPTADDVARLPYARMVFEEALRLFPTIWYMDRVALEDDVVSGYRVPAGSLVALSPYVTHRRPDVWDDADAFDPERFTPERRAAIPRLAYFPFGAGPRTCVGGHLAMLEGQLALAMIARRFAFERPPGAAPVPEPYMALHPRGGMSMRIRRV
jgi:cytochrome P450